MNAAEIAFNLNRSKITIKEFVVGWIFTPYITLIYCLNSTDPYTILSLFENGWFLKLSDFEKASKLMWTLTSNLNLQAP